MYIAKKKIREKFHYFIRESFEKGDLLGSRDLFDLGTNPGDYIVYPGGNAYYIDPSLEEQLHSLGVLSGFGELDELFWPFVDPEIKRVLEGFRRREQARRPKRGLSTAERDKLRTQTHLFDKRRIHYLKFGRTDQGYIGGMPVKLYKWVRGKSRDEIEQRFVQMEQVLRPTDLRIYVYVIFDLQRFFSSVFAKNMPQAVDQVEMEKHFLEELCRLNEDKLFWLDAISEDKLHEYLIRYTIMFFDYDYAPGNFLNGYIKDFMDRHRFYRPPVKKSSISLDEASTIFGIKKEALKTMTKGGLTRLYYREAHKLHPDKGGDQDKFIRLTEAYQQLLRGKGRKGSKP